MGEQGYNTNLSAEYYVLSMLYRMSADAYLTIGNKKSVDIMVKIGGNTLSIDVKGLAGETNFPIDNWNLKGVSHFLVFVSFRNRISDPQSLPECYIVPSQQLEEKHSELNGESIIYVNPKGNRKVVELRRLRKIKQLFLDRWDFLT